MKHHFIAQFYLKPWTGPDLKLCEMKLVHGQVKPLRRYTAETGFQHDLYRIPNVPSDIAQDFEKRFMSLVDGRATHMQQRLLANNLANWTAQERSAWARFIMSFLFRNPHNVSLLKGHITAMWDAAMASLQENYEEWCATDYPATFAEYMEKINPAAAHIGASNFLAKIIDNETIGQTIVNLNWSIIDLSKSKFSLLTSDRPFVMPNALGDPKAFIAIPISPTKLFLASKDATQAAHLQKMKPADVVKEINKAIVSQAREFVWGDNDSQVEFVRKHIAKAPEREIISQEQMKLALDAAKDFAKTDFEEALANRPAVLPPLPS